MRYLPWAFLALAAYTLVAPLVSIVTRDVPSDVTVLITNSVLTLTALGLVVYNDQAVLRYLDPGHPKAGYMYLTAVLLAVGIIAYYRALALGPVSVVVPIFGLFLVTSSIVGIVALEETLTARKVAGITFAMLAVYLTSVE
jgi:transporter family protein